MPMLQDAINQQLGQYPGGLDPSGNPIHLSMPIDTPRAARVAQAQQEAKQFDPKDVSNIIAAWVAARRKDPRLDYIHPPFSSDYRPLIHGQVQDFNAWSEAINRFYAQHLPLQQKVAVEEQLLPRLEAVDRNDKLLRQKVLEEQMRLVRGLRGDYQI